MVKSNLNGIIYQKLEYLKNLLKKYELQKKKNAKEKYFL